jgi:hypothetical protein
MRSGTESTSFPMRQILQRSVSIKVASHLVDNRRTELVRGLEHVMSLDKMPVTEQSTALWDINVTIKSSAPFQRLISVNHPIQIQFAADKTLANVQLAPSIDKKKVPCKDFVLMFRDTAMDKGIPIAMSVNGSSGQ